MQSNKIASLPSDYVQALNEKCREIGGVGAALLVHGVVQPLIEHVDVGAATLVQTPLGDGGTYLVVPIVGPLGVGSGVYDVGGRKT